MGTFSSPTADDHTERSPQPTRDRIPILRPRLPDADALLPYLRRIDQSRIYTNWGPLASELEHRLSNHWQLPDGSVVSASSGTSALIGAILATAGRARPNRPFAVVPAFTFVATALAAEQCGYRPYLADVDPDTWQLDLDALDPDILNQAGVVIPVAPFGRAVAQQAWAQFHRRTQIPVVIDGGASFETVSSDPAHYIGEVPVAMSFHATKSFSTGEGGCVVVHDRSLPARITQALNFGFYADRECASPSTNGKMSEYHAAVGLAELDGWPAKYCALSAVADRYRERLRAIGLVDRFFSSPTIAGCYALWRCADDREATSVQASLNGADVEFRLWYGNGLHTQPHYRDTPRSCIDVTNGIASLIVGLPVAPDFPDSFLERIVTVLDAVANKRSC